MFLCSEAVERRTLAAFVALEICLVRRLTAIFVCGLINRSGGWHWQVLSTLGT
jgi:hypothetical protein